MGGNSASALSRCVAGSSHLHDVHDVRAIDNGCIAVSRALLSKGEPTLDYLEVLRLMTINDDHFADHYVTDVGSARLDPKTLALVRIGALVAVGGAVPSYGAEADAAVSAGATAAEIVEVLLGVVSVVGRPHVVAAAPSLAMALGYDVYDAFERQAGG
jgi:4-carboxymuconolactone decarboxylase